MKYYDYIFNISLIKYVLFKKKQQTKNNQGEYQL